MSERPGLLELCRVLLKHAAFTVGGGSVTTIALERDVVDRLHWFSLDRFRTLYGLSRLTPGTNILAQATGMGWDVAGLRGACAALACAAVPGSMLAALLASGYQQIYQSLLAQRFLLGAAAAVCGFIAASLLKLLQPYLKADGRWVSLLVFVFAFAISMWGVSPFPVVLGLAVAGYVSAR